jgi:hypothetical protein
MIQSTIGTSYIYKELQRYHILEALVACMGYESTIADSHVIQEYINHFEFVLCRGNIIFQIELLKFLFIFLTFTPEYTEILTNQQNNRLGHMLIEAFFLYHYPKKYIAQPSVSIDASENLSDEEIQHRNKLSKEMVEDCQISHQTVDFITKRGIDMTKWDMNYLLRFLSDPKIIYNIIQHTILKFNPQKVLDTINSNDLEDMNNILKLHCLATGILDLIFHYSLSQDIIQTNNIDSWIRLLPSLKVWSWSFRVKVLKTELFPKHLLKFIKNIEVSLYHFKYNFQFHHSLLSSICL